VGLFDFFQSEEKLIQKHHRRLTDRDATPEDREASAHWLTQNGKPQALLALLARFDLKLDHQLKDKGEKDQIFSLALGVGQPVHEPLRTWLGQCRHLAQPLQLYRELAGATATIDLALQLLERERAKDDFKPDRKKALLVWLAENRDPRLVQAAAPFLNDFDEYVRYAAVEVLVAQEAEAAREPLLARLMNPDEDSNRLRARVAEVFVQRRWPLGEAAAALADRLPGGYALRDGRLVAA
jgi:hypothetical protein